MTALPRHVTGSARPCIKVGGVFYPCDVLDGTKNAITSAVEALHQQRETNADTVVNLLLCFFLVGFTAAAALVLSL